MNPVPFCMNLLAFLYTLRNFQFVFLSDVDCGFYFICIIVTLNDSNPRISPPSTFMPQYEIDTRKEFIDMSEHFKYWWIYSCSDTIMTVFTVCSMRHQSVYLIFIWICLKSNIWRSLHQIFHIQISPPGLGKTQRPALDTFYILGSLPYIYIISFQR